MDLSRTQQLSKNAQKSVSGGNDPWEEAEYVLVGIGVAIHLEDATIVGVVGKINDYFTKK